MRARQSVTIILVEDKVSDFPFASNFSTNSFRYIYFFFTSKIRKNISRREYQNFDETLSFRSGSFALIYVSKIDIFIFHRQKFRAIRESSNYFYLITIVIEIYGY